jgi:hypothetical protein
MLRRFLSAFVAISISLAATAASSGDQEIAAARRVLKDSDDYRLRVDAAARLGASGDPKARRPLEAALEDAHPAVRQAAANALVKLGDNDALPALEARAKKEPNAPTRAVMNKALVDLKAAVPAPKPGVATASAAIASPPASSVGSASSAPANGTSPPGIAGAGIIRTSMVGGAGSAVGPDWSTVKYVVKVNTVTNTSGVRGEALTAVLDACTRAKLSSIPGVFVAGDDPAGTSALTTAATKGVPVLGVDVLLVSIDAQQFSSEVRVQAKISLALTKLQVIKVNIEGSAYSVGSASSAKSEKSMGKLQEMAVDGAVVSAMTKAPRALKSAAGS